MAVKLWRRFLGDTSGASAVEYAVLVATLILTMAVGLMTFPPALQGVVNAISTAISNI